MRSTKFSSWKIRFYPQNLRLSGAVSPGRTQVKKYNVNVAGKTLFFGGAVFC